MPQPVANHETTTGTNLVTKQLVEFLVLEAQDVVQLLDAGAQLLLHLLRGRIRRLQLRLLLLRRQIGQSSAEQPRASRQRARKVSLKSFLLSSYIDLNSLSKTTTGSMQFFELQVQFSKVELEEVETGYEVFTGTGSVHMFLLSSYIHLNSLSKTMTRSRQFFKFKVQLSKVKLEGA